MSDIETVDGVDEAAEHQLKESRPTRFIPIPPGSSQKPCSCGALIYFSAENERTGKRQPISMDHPQALHPTSTTFGQGISHFSDCPDAEKFRRPKSAS